MDEKGDRNMITVNLYYRGINGSALAVLREKYDLHMTAERFVSEDMGKDDMFIRK